MRFCWFHIPMSSLNSTTKLKYESKAKLHTVLTTLQRMLFVLYNIRKNGASTTYPLLYSALRAAYNSSKINHNAPKLPFIQTTVKHELYGRSHPKYEEQ